MPNPSLPANLLLAPLALLILLSLLMPLILGLRIFTTCHGLNLIRLQKRADALNRHIYTPFSLLLHQDSEAGIIGQDPEATKVMAFARHVALFGPLACVRGL